MSEGYRSPAERREILCAVLSEERAKPLTEFHLSAKEEVFYRARAARALRKLVKKTGPFKEYYALPVRRPIRNVQIASAAMILTALLATFVFYLYLPPGTDETPLFTGSIAVVVASVGWAVAGWLTHRNAIRQTTNSMLFARFAQAQFGDAIQRFHRKWGFDVFPGVSEAELDALRTTGNEEDWKTATSVGYLLNYFELVANGVLQGDLDDKMVRENFRGVICFYHDKCWPLIRSSNQEDSRIFEGLIKLRTHYRDV